MRWLLPLLLLAGCIPIPMERVYVPHTAGALMSGGVPVEGARVYRVRAYPPPHAEPAEARAESARACRAAPDTVAVTSASGAFELPAVARRTVERYVPITEAPPQAWTTCFIVGADTLTSPAFVWPPVPRVRLLCDASALTMGERCGVLRLTMPE